MQKEMISTVMRFCYGNNSELLFKAIESVIAQTYSNVQIVLCVQNLPDEMNQEFTHRVGCLIRKRCTCREELKRDFIIINVKVENLKDGRAKMLNAGIKSATGRYLAFLDYDDLIFDYAYDVLVEKLELSGATIAFGGCIVCEESSKKGTWQKKLLISDRFGRSVLDLLHSNFAPIHSFVVDRKELITDSMLVNERLCALEDYYFLLRIIKGRTTINTDILNVPVCEYYFRNDGTNSTVRDTDDKNSAEVKRKVWDEAREIIAAYKREISVNVKWDLLSGYIQIQKYMSKKRSKIALVFDFMFLFLFSGDLFDKRYYKRQYAPQEIQCFSILWHYVKHGSKNLMPTSARFDAVQYFKDCSKIAARGYNPLVHYVWKTKLCFRGKK